VSKRSWTPQEIRELGVRTDVPTASSILGIGQVKGYEFAKAGKFPVPVLRAGKRYIVPVAGLLTALGIEADQRQLTA
jgi:predicted site-specific integrase-resolvase